MSHHNNRSRSSRQNYQSVDWDEQFAAFERQPTWDKYFRLRKKVRKFSFPRGNMKYDLLDKLDKMAMPLITQRERVIAVCKAFKLELGNTLLRKVWNDYDQRCFGLDLIKDAWNLHERPGKQLWFKVLSTEVRLSSELRQAPRLLQEGSLRSKMSPNDTLALLLWLRTKYSRQTEIISLAKQLRQALRDGNASEPALWQELALLLGPPEQGLDKKETLKAPQAMPEPQDTTSQVAPEPKAPQVEPEPKAPQATQEVSEPPSAPVVRPPSPEASPAVSEAAQEVLMAWQEAVGAFTTLVREQAAGVAQRDQFINLLQHQISNADQRTQEAREQAETKVKRTLMQLLAEPLEQFQVAVALYEERDFSLIYDSFTQALAQLGITPIGEVDRQFTVSQNDLVRSIDGQPVVGQKVEQLGLGWQLQLSNGNVHPLVYPRVRRLNR